MTVCASPAGDAARSFHPEFGGDYRGTGQGKNSHPFHAYLLSCHPPDNARVERTPFSYSSTFMKTNASGPCRGLAPPTDLPTVETLRCYWAVLSEPLSKSKCGGVLGALPLP